MIENFFDNYFGKGYFLSVKLYEFLWLDDNVFGGKPTWMFRFNNLILKKELIIERILEALTL